MDRPIVANVHPKEEDQMDETWKNQRILRSWNRDGNAVMKEDRWKMDQLASVDNVELEESKMF